MGDSKTLIARLRELAGTGATALGGLLTEAADIIDRLEKEQSSLDDLLEQRDGPAGSLTLGRRFVRHVNRLDAEAESMRDLLNAMCNTLENEPELATGTEWADAWYRRARPHADGRWRPPPTPHAQHEQCAVCGKTNCDGCP